MNWMVGKRLPLKKRIDQNKSTKGILKIGKVDLP